MAALPTPDQADELLAAGAITPEQHAAIRQSQPANNNFSMTPVGAAADDDPFGLKAMAGGGSGPAPIALPGAPSLPPALPSQPTPPQAAPAALAPAPAPAKAVAPPRADLAPPAPAPAPSDLESVAEGRGIPTLGKAPVDPLSLYPKEVQSRFRAVETKRAGLAQAEQQYNDALAQREQAKADAAAEQADFLAKRDAELKARVEANEAAERQRQAEHRDRVAQVERASEEAANAKIDGNHFWASRDTGQAIAAGVGLALGAMGSALAGGPNYALNVIEGAIARDVDAQKFNVGQKWKAAEAKRGVLRDLESYWGDQRVAEQHAYELSYRQAERQLETLKAKAGSADQQAAANQLQAELRAKAEAARVERLETIDQLYKQQLAALAARSEANAEKARATYAATYKEVLTSTGDPAQAEAEAARQSVALHGADAAKGIKGAGMVGDRPAGESGGPTTKAAREKLRENVEKNKAMNAEFNDMKASKDLDQLGAFTKLASVAPGANRVMPDSTRVNDTINAINLRANAAAGALLKDSEGRIAPAQMEALHKLDVEPGDTPAQARRKLEGKQDLVNAISGQTGNKDAPGDRLETKKGRGPVGPAKLPGSK